MTTLTEKEVRAIVRTVMSWEKGKAASEFDACFKRGYRTACRNVIDLLESTLKKRSANHE